MARREWNVAGNGQFGRLAKSAGFRRNPQQHAGTGAIGQEKTPTENGWGFVIGGGGGNRTRVRKPYIPGPTCLAVFLILVVHYPSGRENDRPAQERFSEPALSTLDTRACERVPRVWMHKHTPVGG